jgi:hypothetical protein
MAEEPVTLRSIGGLICVALFRSLQVETQDRIQVGDAYGCRSRRLRDMGKNRRLQVTPVTFARKALRHAALKSRRARSLLVTLRSRLPAKPLSRKAPKGHYPGHSSRMSMGCGGADGASRRTVVGTRYK